MFLNLRFQLSLMFILLAIVLWTNCDDSTKYTQEERKLIPELRKRVKLNLTQDIMNEDKYLVRFLRAQYHDIDRAESMVKENLDWRRENKMDSILMEDFSSWRRRIPFTLHMRDKEGRPSMSSSINYMDTRKLLLSGRGDEFRRYVLYAIESAVHNLHNASKISGKEFTDGWLLFDMALFNQRIHLCHPCIPLWIEVIQNYEKYYPQLARSIIVVNTPRLYPHVYHLIKPILSSHTFKNVRVYDFDKGRWKAELLKIFSENNLTPEFGGNASAQDPGLQISPKLHSATI